MNFIPNYKNSFRILKGGKISLVVSSFLAGTTLSFAAPSGGVVTSGSANISQNGKVTDITQSTQKASINWNKFNIASDETVNFKQPNSSSITLNRVVGNEKSIINGALNANGQVWIINSNGVLFGKGASINTAGLLATTKELSDTDFQAGKYNFKGSSTESVINLGEIDISDSGYATLLANTVSNEGTIKAVKGSVRLIGANEVTINLNGNSIVDLTVEKGILDSLVENKGAIYSDGGEIYLTTNAVDELLKGVVNNEGIIEANSLDGVTGFVELFAHGGEAKIGGTITAKEGFVETSGKDFTFNDAKIEAGEWLIDPVNVTIDDSLADAIETQLGNGDVTIETETSSSTVDTSANESAGEGNITVNSDITWSEATRLTLDAVNNIYMNAIIENTNATDGGVYFQARNVSDAVVFDSNAKVIINNANQLQWMNTARRGNYELGSDIDASDTINWNNGQGWKAIGGQYTGQEFQGTFDGLGHTIDKLYINNPSELQGLFAFIDGATIQNVGITNADFTVGSKSGILVGKSFSNDSTISHVYTSGKIKAYENTDNYDMGGLIGENFRGIISSSYSTASVSGYNNVGGLVGGSYTSISSSYATGPVSGYNNVGGLVGSNFKTISTSYATGSVSGDEYVGGLAGSNGNNSSISTSYAIGSVSGDRFVGGLVGGMGNGIISTSYATGSVSGSNSIGGLVGGIANGTTPTITNSYASNTVSQSDSSGGLIGSFYSFENYFDFETFEDITIYTYTSYNDYTDASSIITNSYFDNETNSQTMGDSSLGKSQSEILSSFGNLSDWSTTSSVNPSIEGYGTTLLLPYLTNVTRDEDKSMGTLFSSGFGTSQDPFGIANWNQLQNINNSNILTQNYYFSLLNNLTTSSIGYTSEVANGQTLANNGTGWTALGNENTKFTGTFDGLGHTIDSLYINNSLDYQGLFGYISQDSTISNLGLTNANISAEDWVGSLVGKNEGTLRNTYSAKANVTGDSSVGILVGDHYGSIYSSYSSGDLKARTNVGGIAGYSRGLIQDSYSLVDITTIGSASDIGGIVGENNANGGQIINSYASNTIIGTGSNIGGLVGNNGGTISNSYYDKEVNTGTTNDSELYGKTTAELKNLALDNWDIETYTATENTYPTLAWQESGNTYTKTWVIGTKVATPDPVDPIPDPVDPKPDPKPEIKKIVDSITNQTATTVNLPANQTNTTTPNNSGRNTDISFSQGENQMLVSKPIEGQATTRVSLSEARQMQIQNGGSGEEVIVPLSNSSIIQLIDGGVNLPSGVEQEFYLANANTQEEK
ncbi:filamentous hemagglutinin N-terminal domain-containing protein [Aliarcobacter butzleri]